MPLLFPYRSYFPLLTPILPHFSPNASLFLKKIEFFLNFFCFKGKNAGKTVKNGENRGAEETFSASFAEHLFFLKNQAIATISPIFKAGFRFLRFLRFLRKKTGFAPQNPEKSGKF